MRASAPHWDLPGCLQVSCDECSRCGRKAVVAPGFQCRDADVAMYQAKRNGRGRYEVFDATWTFAAI